MHTALEVLRYVIAGVFVLIGLGATIKWVRTRDKRQAHLAWATGALGLGSVLSVITLYQFPFPNPTRLFAPIGLVMVSTALIFICLYAFLFFLADFIRYPVWARILATAGLLLSLVFTFTLRSPVGIVGAKVVQVEPRLLGIEDFTRYWYWCQTAVFAILAIALLAYALRVRGLARFRMTMAGIAAGILCVCAGAFPLYYMTRHGGDGLWFVLDVFTGIAAVMLYLGFTTPRAISDRFSPEPTPGMSAG